MIKGTKRRPCTTKEPSDRQIDEAQVLAELRDFKARSERLGDMRPELLKKYPDQHVALTENGILVAAMTIEEVVEKINELGERSGFAARMHLNTKPRPRRIPG